MELEKQPFIGALEPLLQARVKEYRYLVQENYKIIYFVEEEKNEVVVANLFDSRQNPSKIEETK